MGSTSSGACTPTLGGQGHPYPAAARWGPAPAPARRSLAVLSEQVHGWKLVPDSLYFQEKVPNSLVYGGVHLARWGGGRLKLEHRLHTTLSSLKSLVSGLWSLVSSL